MVAVGYREGVLARLVEDYKYQSIRATAGVLAELMAASLRGFLVGEVVVVPLPTIGKHVRERGFDHTLLLAKKLARIRKWRVEKILERLNKTVQVGSDVEKRKEQAKGAYRVSKKFSGRLKESVTYLLVDDVWTTGASMEAAIQAMRKAGAKKIVGAVILVPTEDSTKKAEP